MGATFTVKSTIDVSRLKRAANFDIAQDKAAIAMLDWMASGSATSAKKPPIREGVLASSGSVFIKGKLMGISPDVASSGTPTPNKSYSGKDVAWGFNTDYAAKMHEDKSLKPGPYSTRDPNMHPGNQWVSEHLQKDKDNYTRLISEFIKSRMK